MKYYVYELVDPRSGVAFYVGKGCRDRVDQHEKEAKSGKVSEKCDYIREIWAEGLRVTKAKIAHFETEAEAYTFEAIRIAQVGLHNLTNVAPGGGGGYTRPAKPFRWTPILFARVERSVRRTLRIMGSYPRYFVLGIDMTEEVKGLVARMANDLGHEFMTKQQPRYHQAVPYGSY